MNLNSLNSYFSVIDFSLIYLIKINFITHFPQVKTWTDFIP